MTSRPGRPRRATGAQPAAWPPTNRIGRRSIKPSSASSSKPRATRVNIAPDAIGADDDIGRPPAERLGDLVGERLRALRVERPQVDVHESPAGLVGDFEAEPVDVVIRALDRDDGRAVRQRVVDLGGLEIGRDEHEGRQPGGRCRGRRRARQVPGRRAGERLDAELERPRGGDGNSPILEAQRRVARVVLDHSRSRPRTGASRSAAISGVDPTGSPRAGGASTGSSSA